MARAGNPYENGMTEKLFTTLKYEEVFLCRYETFEDVVTTLPYLIAKVYNQKRFHSAFNCRPPGELEEAPLNKEKKDVPRQTLLTSSVQS